MSVDKFKFISPGIFVNEIDNTGRAATPEDVGPALIGRSEKGPILQPIRVNSYFEFVKVFGQPIPGGKGGDVFRDGNYTSPTYAAYAAQAWFRNNSPITFIRIGGRARSNGTGDGLAGWKTTDVEPHTTTPNNGGAYGLFVADAPACQFIQSASLDVDAEALQEGQYIRIFANGMERLFISSSTTQTTKDPGGASAEMTFMATASCTSPIEGGLCDADDNERIIAFRIAEVINSSSLPVTCSVEGVNPIVGITASCGDLPTLSVGVEIGFDTTAANFTLLTLGPNTISNEIAVATTGTMSASYGHSTGTLAAIWYIDQSASIGLSGTTSVSGTDALGTSMYIDSVGTKEFKVQISSSLKGIEVDSAFNFTDTSSRHIRKVFNTNPILTNDSAVEISSNSFSRYWLGESYEGSVNQVCVSSSGAGAQIGVILPLLSGTVQGGDFTSDSGRLGFQDAQTGYFFSQDLGVGTSATGSYNPANMQKLFRLVARNSGDWVSRNVKVSIDNLRASPNETANPYGTFSVVLRALDDTDNRIKVLERFDNCNLNPNSEGFILRKIGDRRYEWDSDDRRYRSLGSYTNSSAYIWIDMPEAVLKADTDAAFLPFGVTGPLRFDSFTDVTGSTGQRATLVSGALDDYGSDLNNVFISGSEATRGGVLFEFPELRLRGSGSEGDPVDPLNAFYGVDTTFNSSRLDPSVRDYLRIKPAGVSDFNTEAITEHSFRFTLDDMCRDGAASAKVFCYKSGSRQANADDETLSRRGGLTYMRGDGSYKEVLDAGVDRFTTVFFGGTDGLNIKESEPLRWVNATSFTDSALTNYMFNSVQGAIDSIRDPEVVEYNLASMPGVTNNTLNMSLIDMCESRGDALAVVDLAGGYTPQYQSTNSEAVRRGTVAETVTTITNELITNSSYGAAYYPWVQVRDLNNGQIVWVPPSVVAIGAMSYSQKASELWFAPAGFTRGGLSLGKAGLPVVGVRDRLTSRDRDKLYENKINPIAQFPAEGIVIFGQKTLQASSSALDRINVRRLMIFLKRQISRYAATILFDQNVQTTWNRFKGQVEPFLRGVQAGLGITQFKLVLDDTTTTPDLVDRNIVYAKIYLKPARSIEYIAIDFILTDSGAAFED